MLSDRGGKTINGKKKFYARASCGFLRVGREEEAGSIKGLQRIADFAPAIRHIRRQYSRYTWVKRDYQSDGSYTSPSYGHSQGRDLVLTSSHWRCYA